MSTPPQPTITPTEREVLALLAACHLPPERPPKRVLRRLRLKTAAILRAQDFNAGSMDRAERR